MGERCEVQLDKPYYYPGDTINGFVICYFSFENKVRDIRVKFKGGAKVYWKVGKTAFSADEDYFEMESNLLSSETTFQPGNYSYPFVFNLPADLPSSVNQDNSNIKYQVKATVDKPWAQDYTAKKNFFIYSYTNLNNNLSLKNPAVFMEEKSYSLLSNNEGIKIVVQLPKTGYVPDEMIFFTCSVRNNASIKIREVRFKFVQGYLLIAQGSTEKLLCLDGQTYAVTNGRVSGNSEQTWDLQMRIPSNVYNGNIDRCNIMKVFWELRGEVCLPLIYPNIKVTIPLTIGSVPFQTNTINQDEQ